MKKKNLLLVIFGGLIGFMMLFLSSWSISMYDFFSRNIDLIETGMEAS